MHEPFTPKPGQIDYTNIRRAPVINCVVRNGDKILIVKRNAESKFYPSYWNGISGFLDDDKTPSERAKIEIREETGIGEEDIVSVREGETFEQEESKYDKTWIIHPVLVDVSTSEVALDWEAEACEWVSPEEVSKFNFIPGFDRVLRALL